jgi:hypothetical protein
MEEHLSIYNSHNLFGSKNAYKFREIVFLVKKIVRLICLKFCIEISVRFCFVHIFLFL